MPQDIAFVPAADIGMRADKPASLALVNGRGGGAPGGEGVPHRPQRRRKSAAVLVDGERVESVCVGFGARSPVVIKPSGDQKRMPS